MSFDSRLFKPILSNSNSANCAFVNAGVSKLSIANSMLLLLRHFVVLVAWCQAR
jgi:hypothetical protein